MNGELSLHLTSDDSCVGALPGPPMPTQAAADLARQLKAMADPVRLRILSIVLAHKDGEACVCDLAVSDPHLAVLCEAGLLESDQRGTWTFYRATETGRHLFSQLSR